MSNFTIGIDEVGRGPVAGPGYLCAVKMPTAFYQKFKNLEWRDKFIVDFVLAEKIVVKKIPPLRDSKKLSKNYKNDWVKIFRALRRANFLDYAIVSFKNTEIDQHGISKCLKKSVENSLKKVLATGDDFIKLDGSLFAPAEFKNQETLIKGDDLEPIISVASILAKVARDEFMIEQSVKFPEYGFEKNAGYGTREHLEAIKKYGICELHRVSFLRGL